MSARIDVNAGEASMANSTATQASTVAPVSTPTAPAVAPGMFATMGPTMTATSGGFTNAETTLKAHMGNVDVHSGQAVVAYEVTNEDNRRSLTTVPGA